MTNSFNINLKKRIISSSSSNILFQFIITISRLIQVPILINFFGADGYGKLLVIVSAASYITLFELGLKYFAINRLTKLYFEEKIDKFNIFYLKILKFIFYISLSLILILSFISVILLFLNYSNDYIIISILLFFINNILITYLYFFSSYFKFEGKLVTNFFFEMLIIVIPIFLIILWTHLKTNSNNFDYIIISLISIFSSIIILIFVKRIIFKKFNFLNAFQIKLNIKYMFIILKRSIFFIIFLLNNLILVHFSTLIIAYYLNNYLVAQFNTLKTITNIIVLSIATLTHPILSEITRYFTDKKTYFINKIINFYFFCSMVILFIINILLDYFGSDIFYIWIKEGIDFDKKLFGLLILSTSLNIINILLSNLILAVNKHIKYSKSLTFFNVFYIIICIILTKYFGILGVVYSLIIYETLHMILLFVIYKLNVNEYVNKILFFILVFIFLIILLKINIYILILSLLLISLVLARDFMQINSKIENK